MRRALPIERVRGLVPAAHGLSTGEVAARRQRFGPNDIIEVAGNPWWELLRDTAKDPMIWFLIGTSALYGMMGDGTEALTVVAATIPLAGMDAWLHRRTQASTEGLSSRLATRATVVRDGVETEVAAADVVPGDLAIVAAGEPFPADGLVLGGANVQVDESVLTGESFPVRKRPLTEMPPGSLSDLAVYGDQRERTIEMTLAAGPSGAEPYIDEEHWGFAGTRVLTGRATLRVVFTGGETRYGEIVRSAVGGRHERTPLQAAIAGLVTVLVAAAAVMCVILALVRLRQGFGWLDALVSAVTLAVAALPEEFPIVFTFFLGVGVFRLAKRQALVRRAVSVENIGRVSCICSDKTGTITEGRLQLTHTVPAASASPERLLSIAALASRRDSNDPLDTAILRAAAARGSVDAAEVLETFPFTEDCRRETAIVREPDGDIAVIRAATKGSPEVVLPMCSLTDAERDGWNRQIAGLAEAGHKVIACALQLLDGGHSGGEPDRGYHLAGVLAFEDPVRDGVATAIATCRTAGIHTIMVTGDHPATARTVAREIGLGDGAPSVLTAAEVEARLASGGGASLRGVDVIARAVPSQKLAIVRALQDAGEVVAVTGDGVNDVPALQAADVGIAMGERGTRSAREVAAIVLLDDNFRTIVLAIGEGRQLFRNLQLSFQYLLMVHIPLVISAALIPLLGFPVLYLPTHIVWLEMIIHPTALLVFQDLPAPDRLGATGSRRSARFFSRREWSLIAAAGTLVTILVVAGYIRSLGDTGNVQHARAMALSLLTFTSAAVTAVLSRLRTWTARLIAAGTGALTIVLVQTPVLAARLHMRPLHLDDWAIVVLGSLAVTGLTLAFGGDSTRRGV
jgi:Ca2+-transporting ATPase